MIPNAHAVMFLLAIDTGVTRSDLEVWQKYVIPSGARSIAVLNKIDLMWDDMKSTADIARDIERQVEQTAALLALPRTQVMAISAQKALLARILGDAGLIAKSGIYQLEQLLASEIIPAKRAILRDAVQREIGGMVEASRATVANQLVAALTELKQFTSLSGKNRNMVQAMVKRLEADQAGYRAAVQTFRTSSNAVVGRGDELLKQLDAAAIERILNKDREFIEGAWTTAGLWKSIQILIQYFTTVSSKMLNLSNQITRLVDMTYVHFHESFGFAKLSPLHLNLEKHSLSMASLRETVKQFCHDPVNVAKYKDFVVDRFYEVLVGQARQIFEATRVDVETWLKGALKPLDMQIKSHEQVLAKRIENLKKIRDNLSSIEERIKGLGKERDKLQQQSKLLARIRFSLDDKPSVKQTRAAL
jgi:hypothetical protein